MRNRSALVPQILSTFIALFLTGCSALSGTIIGSGQSDHSQPAIVLSPEVLLGRPSPPVKMAL